jgi:hypothetical protein
MTDCTSLDGAAVPVGVVAVLAPSEGPSAGAPAAGAAEAGEVCCMTLEGESLEQALSASGNAMPTRR